LTCEILIKRICTNWKIAMIEEHSWYQIVDCEVLQQGDLIDSCPIAIPCSAIKENTIVDFKVYEYNIVIMSQSCDLVPRRNGKPKLEFVVACSVWFLDDLVSTFPDSKPDDSKERLRRGYQPAFHLLNKCEIEGFARNFLVVDFRQIFSIPFNSLTEIARERGSRLRLLTPYREHLSQAFARYFMRVGLPSDIPPFK
jgi:hypothetical protein